MIDVRDFESVMEGWGEYCLEGCGVGLGYPKSSPFVNDYKDHQAGPVALIDDHPMLDDIEAVVARTAEIHAKVPDVIRAHYKAQFKWLETSHKIKLKKLEISGGNYYKYLHQGQFYIQGALSEKWGWLPEGKSLKRG